MKLSNIRQDSSQRRKVRSEEMVETKFNGLHSVTLTEYVLSPFLVDDRGQNMAFRSETRACLYACPQARLNGLRAAR